MRARGRALALSAAAAVSLLVPALSLIGMLPAASAGAGAASAGGRLRHVPPLPPRTASWQTSGSCEHHEARVRRPDRPADR
jgi:hypothetical protein